MNVFRATRQPMWGVSFSPNGRYLAAGGGKGDVRVWDTAGSAKPARVPDTLECKALSFAADDTLLVSCRGREPRALRWPGGAVATAVPAWAVYAAYSVAFTPDAHVVHGSHNEMSCWNALTGEHLWDADPGRYWSRMAAGPGDLLAVVTDFKRLSRWNRATGTRTATAELDTDSVIALACSPDGRTVALSTGFDVILWDVKKWAERTRIKLPSICGRLEYHPRGDRLLAAAGAFRLLSADLKHEVRAYDFSTSEVLSMTFAADGLRTAVGCGNGDVVVWDIDD